MLGRPRFPVPITFSSGAGSSQHILEVFRKTAATGAGQFQFSIMVRSPSQTKKPCRQLIGGVLHLMTDS